MTSLPMREAPSSGSRHRPDLRLRLGLCLGLLFTSVGNAQTIASVSGTVRNETGYPLEAALVTLDPAGPSRQVRADRDGRYSFLGVTAGRHVLRATWVGYSPEERSIDVTEGVVTVDFTLQRLTRLDTVTVTARRTGLYGRVIAIDSLLPVPGARIEVLGSRKVDSTDANGVFTMPQIKPGSYIVRVKHPLFESRNVPVFIPADSSAELDIVVKRGLISRDQHMEMLYREMDSRLNYKGLEGVMITRDQLRGREKQAMDLALRFVPEFAKRNYYLTSDICVFVDGLPRPGAQITDFRPEEIEAIEFYGDPIGRSDPTGSLARRWPPRAPCGMPPVLTNQPSGRSVVKVRFAVIWLKQP